MLNVPHENKISIIPLLLPIKSASVKIVLLFIKVTLGMKFHFTKLCHFLLFPFNKVSI